MAHERATTPSDEELVVRIRTQTPDDFRLVVERYQQALFRYVLSYITDQAKAEDIVQEAFIKMYINLNSFDEARTFSAWAYRIVHNEMVSHLRKNQQDIIPDDDAWIPQLADDRPSLAEDLDRKLSHQKLYRAIGRLPLKYRQVLILYYFQGCDYESVATITGVPASTVSTRLSRAKARLKKILIKEHDDG